MDKVWHNEVQTVPWLLFFLQNEWARVMPFSTALSTVDDAKGINGYQNFSSKQLEIGKEIYVEGVREQS